jgi:hypothetical protein
VALEGTAAVAIGRVPGRRAGSGRDVEDLEPFRLIDGRWGPRVVGICPSMMTPLMADYWRAQSKRLAA